jgi:FlaG/FlaF family flagellin (archaellin)
MVAITVILAAVIGTFVLGLGEQVEQNARAGVNADVDAANANVTISVTTLDNSDYVLVRDSNSFADFNIAGSGGTAANAQGDTLILNTTGQTLDLSATGDTSGTMTIVAVIGEEPSSTQIGSTSILGTSNNPGDGATETTVQQVDYELSP